MNIPKDTALTLLITNPALRPWIKKPTAEALAEAFGCSNYDTSTPPKVISNVDPTVADILNLTDKQIIDAPKLDQAAVRQVHALRSAING